MIKINQGYTGKNPHHETSRLKREKEEVKDLKDFSDNVDKGINLSDTGDDINCINVA